MPYVTPLTITGAVLALTATGDALDWRLLITIFANILAVAYAFMINDVVDAPDDALEAHRAARNPVTSGELTPREGWVISLVVGAAALILYALVNTEVLIIGVITLILSHLYSWKPVRLKAYPITDVVSHSLMLSGLLYLAGYYAYHNSLGEAWLVFAALVLISVYGQLYNQLRDFNMDKAAGLHNTAIMVGEKLTTVLMYLAVLAAVAAFIVAIVVGVLPLWVVLFAVAGMALTIYFIRSSQDSRGGQAADFSGNIQLQILLVANALNIVWLLVIVLGNR
ncbi:MAG: hypothetical protein OHK0023_20550 [Anaerolineae bacterium]